MELYSRLSSLNRKSTANKSKHLLVENELNKLKKFHSSYFIGKSHFEEHGTQNFLVFQPIVRCFKLVASSNSVLSWKSNRLSAENITMPITSESSIIPKLNHYGNKVRVKFTGSCLKQSIISYTHGTILNTYELGASTSNNNNSTLKNCLFGAVYLTKNTDIDKYGYSGYGIGFDKRSSF